jgi:hypothetical protein
VNLKPLPLLNVQSIPPEEPRLRLNPDGSLEIGGPGGQIECAFRFMGLAFSANTRPTGAGTVLQLSAEIGPLPYSAEGAGLRSAVFAVVDASQRMDGARLVISSRRWIYCIGKAALKEGWQANDAITAAARLVLVAKPYLVLLAEILPGRPPWKH